MTKAFKNSMITNFICWMISFTVIGFNIHLIINYLDELNWPVYAVVFCILYFTFVLYLIYIPLEIPASKESEVDAEENL
jgi:hypothetical protein